MADTQATEGKAKKTRTVKPKPIYVVTPADTEILLVTKNAEEVFKTLSENPGAVVKVEQI